MPYTSKNKVGVRTPTQLMISMVDVTPALFALNRCSLRRKAPLIIDRPGMSRTPASRLPTTEPSTRSAFDLASANEYRKICSVNSGTVDQHTSIKEPNVALMVAPTPMVDWAEMEATAMPMK